MPPHAAGGPVANPARWRGHVANMLPPRSKVRRVEHHAALPWQEIGDFMAELKARRHCRPRLTLYNSDRSPDQRGHWREVGRG